MEKKQLSNKAVLQLHASAEAVIEKSAERVPCFGFPIDKIEKAKLAAASV